MGGNDVNAAQTQKNSQKKKQAEKRPKLKHQFYYIMNTEVQKSTNYSWLSSDKV